MLSTAKNRKKRFKWEILILMVFQHFLHRWTKSGHFFPKVGHFFEFSKQGSVDFTSPSTLVVPSLSNVSWAEFSYFEWRQFLHKQNKLNIVDTLAKVKEITIAYYNSKGEGLLVFCRLTKFRSILSKIDPNVNKFKLYQLSSFMMPFLKWKLWVT